MFEIPEFPFQGASFHYFFCKQTFPSSMLFLPFSNTQKVLLLHYENTEVQTRFITLSFTLKLQTTICQRASFFLFHPDVQHTSCFPSLFSNKPDSSEVVSVAIIAILFGSSSFLGFELEQEPRKAVIQQSDSVKFSTAPLSNETRKE